MADPLTWKLNVAVHKWIEAEKDFAYLVTGNTKQEDLQAAVKKMHKRRAAYNRELQKVYDALEAKARTP